MQNVMDWFRTACGCDKNCRVRQETVKQMKLSEEIEWLSETASKGPWKHEHGRANREIVQADNRALIADICDAFNSEWPRRDGDYWADGELIVLLRNNVDKIVQALRNYELKETSDVVKES